MCFFLVLSELPCWLFHVFGACESMPFSISHSHTTNIVMDLLTIPCLLLSTNHCLFICLFIYLFNLLVSFTIDHSHWTLHSPPRQERISTTRMPSLKQTEVATEALSLSNYTLCINMYTIYTIHMHIVYIYISHTHTHHIHSTKQSTLCI